MAASASERCRIGVIDRCDPLLTSRQSNNFQNVDFSHLTFPNYLRIDYIRVYQKSGGSVGCDPSGEWSAAYLCLRLCHVVLRPAEMPARVSARFPSSRRNRWQARCWC